MIPTFLTGGLVLGAVLARRVDWLRWGLLIGSLVAIGLMFSWADGPLTVADYLVVPILAISNVLLGAWVGWLVFRERS
jgi:hypothetical protein